MEIKFSLELTLLIIHSYCFLISTNLLETTEMRNMISFYPSFCLFCFYFPTHFQIQLWTLSF